MQRDFIPAATGGGLTSHSMGNSASSAQTQGSSSMPLSLVPEKAILGHQIRSAVPAQYWGMSIASASSPDGAVASHVSEPAPLPLLAGSGLSRTHLLLATQALKVPGQPSAPGLPSMCQNEGGLVLDRVLAHAGGDSWWAILSGRARLGRIAAQRADLSAAAGDPSNYSLCANSRVQLSRHTVLRSRLDWRPPATPVRVNTASDTNGSGVEADAGSSAGAVANGGSDRGQSRGCRRGWAAPMSLSCQLRSRVAARTEVRADLAIRQRAASSFPCSLIPVVVPSPPQTTAASAASAGPYEKGSAREGSSPGLRRPRVAEAEAEDGSCVWAARTPLLIGLQAGSVGATGSPLVWRCGVLQVTAPPTVRLAGSCGSGGAAAAGGPTLQSAVYVQGTVGLQGERYLWRAPTKPQRRRGRSDAGAVATAAASSSATGHVAEAVHGSAAAAGPTAAQTPPPPPAPGLGPHNPVRQAAGYVLNRIGGRGGGPAGDDDDDSGRVAARGGGVGGKAGATMSAAAGGGGEPPFGIELPTAGQVQESLMDATQSISRLRDDVTQAAQWVAGGGLVEQLSAAPSGAAGGGGVAARQRQQQQQQQEQSRAERAGTPWSAFVGPPNVKVAGVAGLTARAPVIMLTHGSAGGGIAPASADGNAGTPQSKAHRGGLLGPALTSPPCLLPVRLAWMHDLGLARLIRRFQGRDVGPKGGEEGAAGPALMAAPAGALLPVSRGSLRPFASAAASLQAGRFSGWVFDFTRLSCQLDCGLWGPAIQGAGGGGASHPGLNPAGGSSGTASRQRHPAFALGDNCAWHSLSVSLLQQVVGPLRFAADWRYKLASSRPLALPPPPAPSAAEPLLRTASGKAALAAAAAAAGAAGAAASWLPGAAAGVAGHLGGMRPQLIDAVYALDLAVPGARGAARLVAWYAPHRREGMVELRMF